MSSQPFDIAAARGLGQALSDAGMANECNAFAADRRRLSKAAPLAVPIEPWFAAAPTAEFPDGKGTRPGVVWEGDFRGLHSLALVNRELTAVLVARNQVALSAWPTPADAPNIPSLASRSELLPCLHHRLAQSAVHVRHQWPPRWNAPAEGRWVLIQPWEFGSLPKDWLGPLQRSVDEVWVHSRHVREAYLAAGLPEERVRVIPLGVDPGRFRPDAAAADLPGAGTFRFLFVGGAIWRKGIDLLLEAFTREFKPDEPVTLLIKGMGDDTFYRGLTANALIAQHRTSGARIDVIGRDFSDAELPGLYTACDCLAHPYRAEGFALPVAEAMACGLPVIVTDGGACRDYCDDATAILVPARRVAMPPARAASLRTIAEPWVYEPDFDALQAAMRKVVADPETARVTGKEASDRIRRDWTWAHAAAAVENRVRALSVGAPPRRFLATATASLRSRVSLCMIVKNEEHNLPDCLKDLSGLFDEIVVADTGSSDRTKAVATALGARIVD
jgi:glycosyltransferase involved in cell wall biosynthesis